MRLGIITRKRSVKDYMREKRSFLDSPPIEVHPRMLNGVYNEVMTLSKVFNTTMGNMVQLGIMNLFAEGSQEEFNSIIERKPAHPDETKLIFNKRQFHLTFPEEIYNALVQRSINHLGLMNGEPYLRRNLSYPVLNIVSKLEPSMKEMFGVRKISDIPHMDIMDFPTITIPMTLPRIKNLYDRILPIFITSLNTYFTMCIMGLFIFDNYKGYKLPKRDSKCWTDVAKIKVHPLVYDYIKERADARGMDIGLYVYRMHLPMIAILEDLADKILSIEE